MKNIQLQRLPIVGFAFLILLSFLLAVPHASANPVLLTQASVGTLYTESFDSYATGADPVGWVDTRAGNSMLENNTFFSTASVSGNIAFGTDQTASNIHSHFIDATSPTWSNYVFTGRMRMTAPDSGIGVTFLSDYNQTDTYYRLRRYGYGGAFHISPHGTSLSGGNANSGVVPATNTWYQFRIEVEESGTQTNIRARVWEQGTAEPTTWQIETFDSSSSRQTVGTVGVWSYTSGSKYWDDFQVTPLNSGPFTLTTSSSAGGTLSVSPDQPDYGAGTMVTLTAVPDPGYQFDGWSGDLSGADNPATLLMNDNKSVTAVFSPIPTYTLSTNQTGSGTLTISPDQPSYQAGELVTLTATPDSGWLFAGWSGDATGTENPLTVTMDGNRGITAVFTEDFPQTISVTVNGNGIVTQTPDQPTYRIGDEVTLTATADPGWFFSGWSGDVTGSNNPVTLTVTQSQTITATFTAQPSALLDEPFTGAVGGDPANWVDTRAGNSMLVNDSIFTRLDVQGNTAFGTTQTASNIHSHFIDANSPAWSNYVFTGRMRMTAADSGIGVTLLSDYNQTDTYYRLRRFGNGGSFRLSPHGTSISGGVTDSGVIPQTNTWYLFRIEVQDTGTQTNIRARVWEQGTAEPTAWQIDAFDSSNSRRTVGTVGVWSHTSGTKLWDDFRVEPLDLGPYTLTRSVTGSGAIAVSPDQSDYSAGTQVTITAVPQSGYQFDGWSGDASGSTNPLTVTMNGNRAITAAFSPIPTYTLTTTVNGSGAVAISPDQPSYQAGEQVTLTATPDANWTFVGWGGDASGSANPLTVTMSRNQTITAVFVEDAPLTLTVNTVGNGTTAVSPNQPTYNVGDQVTITAQPAPGWRLDSWSSSPSVTPGWWDSQWAYRLPVTVGAAGFTRTDKPVELQLNFTTLLAGAGTFDLNALRVIEVDANGNLLSTAVPFQFDPAPNYNATTNAAGTLIFLMEGNTGPSATRSFHIYFDVTGKGFAPASVPAQVTVTDNVIDEGQASYQINTANATYLFQKTAGGFSSLLDAQGNDWISYSAASGSAGAFRGIPNLVYPEGHLHPGATSATSSILSQGPLKTAVRSITNDGLWETVWEFYPQYAVMTVLQTGHNYWFLYEGTPGGSLDGNSDIVVRADGTQTLAGTAWTGDLVGEEWVYFGDPALNRSLYVINHAEDTAVDSYYAMNGEMTVMGFGRQSINSFLSTTPASFTIGLMDETSYAQAAPVVRGAYRAVNLTVGSVQTVSSGGGTAVNPLTFTMTANQTVTAHFVEEVPVTLTVNSSGSGTVTVSPDQPSYLQGEPVTLTAVPANGWQFDGWSGDASGSSNPLTVTMNSNKSVTATFTQLPTDGPVIDVWYGNTQPFGQLGQPQPWVNILGTVSDSNGVASLAYRLNGGPSRPLSMGDDKRRLAAVGDFNIDLATSQLIDGANQVAITAVDNRGNTTVKTITVNYQSGTVWPVNYSIDWSSVSNIQDVAQIVDGEWALQGDGVRILDPDYDRLIAVGDVNWTDYEVVVPVTIHAVDGEGFVSGTSGGAAIGLLMRWNGHTDMPVSGWQPKTGWLPYGAIGWYWWNNPNSANLRIDGNNGFIKAQGSSITPPTVGGTYLIKMRVETIPNNGGSTYSLKFWPAGQSEPASWNLTAQEGPGNQASGSVLLLAHHIDATFGDVTVTPLGNSVTNLTLNTQGSGSVSASPSKPTYSYGEQVTLTATPAPGWIFTGWQGSVTSSQNPVTLAMDGDKTVTAVFADTTAPPVISNVDITAYVDSAVIAWTTDKPTSGTVAYGTTTGYELGTAVSSQLQTSHMVTLTNLTSNTPHHFQIAATDANNNSATTGDNTFSTLDENAVGGVVSDDFSSCLLNNGLWSFINPLNDGTISVSGGQLRLGVPGGSGHDVWSGGNFAPRVMQSATDDDFEVEVKFESAVTQSYALQGIIVEQDANNFLRFDFYGHNGITYVFAAQFTNGSPTSLANVPLAVSTAPLYMRVTRVGDTWTQSYSTNGSSWTAAANFTFALTVNEVGVFAGNAGNNPAHTAVVDYFFNTAAPIVPEDGGGASYALTVQTTGNGSVTTDPQQSSFACGEAVTVTAVPANGWQFDGWNGDLSGAANPATLTMNGNKTVTAVFSELNGGGDTTPPLISNVQVVPGANSATVSWTTNEPATSSVAYGETTGYELGNVSGGLQTNHTAVLSNLASNTMHHYRITVTDASNNAASTADATFTTTAVSTGFASDDFNSCALDPDWTFVNPLADASYQLTGTQLRLNVPGGSSHDVWTGGNFAPRLMRSLSDEDFELEAKFDSLVTGKFSMQGVLLEQDSNNFLRFDTYSNNNVIYLFVARFTNGSPAVLVNTPVSLSSSPVYLRLGRVGSQWTLAYSTNGSSWSTATTLTDGLVPAQVGVFAGNAGDNPAYTAVVDYFFNSSAPIVPEDANGSLICN